MRRQRTPIWYRSPYIVGIAIAIALNLVACGGGSSKNKKREVILRSEDVDRKVGQDVAKEAEAQLGLIEDPQLVSYVNELGHRLARHAPRRRFSYKFHIVDQQAANAFALPGGYIFISRGLLVLTNSEDELANVIGHEIVHVAARHAAARQEMGRILPTGLNWMQGRYLAAYGRDQEREADRLGQGLAAVAGYDPEGMADFLRELEHTERLRRGASRLPHFGATHPLTTRRAAEAGARARMTSWTRGDPIADDKADYLRRMEGLAIGSRAAEGVFEGERFFHADLDFAIRFPPGWTMKNTHQAVGAISRKGDAQIFLEGQAPSDDVETAAAEHIDKMAEDGFKLEHTQPLKIGSYPAFRAEGRFGNAARVVITWILRDGAIFRITGAAQSGYAFKNNRGAFLQVPRSFRALQPNEREKIRETRLRIAVARGGESLSDLSKRTENRWDIQQTAVMNDVFATAKLSPGQLIKVAVSESYKPSQAR